MKNNFWSLLFLGGCTRYFLSNTNLAKIVANRVEFATPLNAYRRIQEGIALASIGVDPYSGDVVHEMPLILNLYKFMLNTLPGALVPLMFILLDLTTAAVLYFLGKRFVEKQLRVQKSLKFAEGTEDLQYQIRDRMEISRMVFLVYLFNPMSILSCIGQTTTVFSNLMLAITLYCLCQRHLLTCLVVLSLESMRSLYPAVLIAPLILTFAPHRVGLGIFIGLIFIACCAVVAALNFLVYSSWSFLDGTLGFIFFYRDLRPNIGLFWYFFTEMFDHFRTMFLITFQMNATVLYLIPLSIKLRREPMILATVLIALITVFRSYPSLGDVAFYLALLPLWCRCWKFMAHTFIVFCFFIMNIGMMGALWHLWIYAGSANANFYFGATLAFSTGQIFLITDLLFAYVKRDFCLYNGQKIMRDGKEAKIVLK